MQNQQDTKTKVDNCRTCGKENRNAERNFFCSEICEDEYFKEWDRIKRRRNLNSFDFLKPQTTLFPVDK